MTETTLWVSTIVITPWLGKIDKEVCESSLRVWMKVNLGLLYEINATRLHQEPLNKHGQHLRNPEANIGEIRPSSATGTLNSNLEQVEALRDARTDVPEPSASLR